MEFLHAGQPDTSLLNNSLWSCHCVLSTHARGHSHVNAEEFEKIRKFRPVKSKVMSLAWIVTNMGIQFSFNNTQTFARVSVLHLINLNHPFKKQTLHSGTATERWEVDGVWVTWTKHTTTADHYTSSLSAGLKPEPAIRQQKR